MNRKKDIYRLDMRLNTKSIADRLYDEGLVECLSDALVNRLTHGLEYMRSKALALRS